MDEIGAPGTGRWCGGVCMCVCVVQCCCAGDDGPIRQCPGGKPGKTTEPKTGDDGQVVLDVNEGGRRGEDEDDDDGCV